MATALYAPAAEDDLVAIAAYIAQDEPEAARRWVQKIRETCDLLAANRMMGEERPGFGVPGCQRWQLRRVFRAVKDGIEVARIVHGSRDITSL